MSFAQWKQIWFRTPRMPPIHHVNQYLVSSLGHHISSPPFQGPRGYAGFTQIIQEPVSFRLLNLITAAKYPLPTNITCSQDPPGSLMGHGHTLLTSSSLCEARNGSEWRRNSQDMIIQVTIGQDKDFGFHWDRIFWNSVSRRVISWFTFYKHHFGWVWRQEDHELEVILS